MVCSRSPAAKVAFAGRLFFGRDGFPFQEKVKILEVEIDQGLIHVKAMVKKGSQSISVLRRVAGFLDRKGRLLLYKAHVRTLLGVCSPLLDVLCSHTQKEAGQHPTLRSSAVRCCLHTSPRA